MTDSQYTWRVANMLLEIGNTDHEECMKILQSGPFKQENLEKFTCLAISMNMRDLVNELFSQGTKCSKDIAFIAAKYGNEDALKRCLAEEIVICHNEYHSVACLGLLDLLKWMAKEYIYRKDGWSNWICAGAAGSGNVEVLRWALEQDYRINHSLAYAASHSHIECIKLILDKTGKWTYLHVEYLGEDIVEFLHNNNFPGKWVSNEKGWGCHDGTCLFCKTKKEIYIKLWTQEEIEVNNLIQWLPEEVAEGVLPLIVRNKF
jgi:hypothetical protein